MHCKFRELINAQIAQLVEQRTENPRVAGSIPALGIFLFSNNQSVSEKLFPQSPTNCDAHLAESLFQTRSGKSRPRRGGLIYFVSILSNVSFSISLDVTFIA